VLRVPAHQEDRVSDDGHGYGRSAGSATGYGLVGMRERAALYGGTATAGPGQRQGWTVTATIPMTESVAQ
jgi:signal transduction histidine kinase